MGDGVVCCRLRVRRCELFEFWGCARAENVGAFVVLEDDHTRERRFQNVYEESKWTSEQMIRGTPGLCSFGNLRVSPSMSGPPMR